jgi:hypothetical protein
MSNLSWLDALKLGATSGVLAGVVNQLAGSVRDQAERHFKAAERAKEAQHQKEMQEMDAERQRERQDRELSFQREKQADDRLHEDLLRRDQAHSDARPTFLPLAESAQTWIDYHWGQDFGADVEFYNVEVVAPSLNTPAEVIAELRRIASGHPTAEIRQKARSLSDSISNVYNSPRQLSDGSYKTEPEVDDYREWFTAVNSLIESMHDPMALPVSAD